LLPYLAHLGGGAVGTTKGQCIQALAGEHARSVSSLQFDERRIVSGSPDWSVRVWDRITGRCVEALEEHMRGVFCVRFDRQKLVTGGGDRLVKVWDWDDDLWCVNTLRGHTGPVLSVDCDDVRLASGATDHTVRLWDFSDPHHVRGSGSNSSLDSSFLSGVTAGTANEDCVLQ
jgi:WD40 repeat protein